MQPRRLRLKFCTASCDGLKGRTASYQDFQTSTRGSNNDLRLSPQNVILGALPFGSMLETFQDKVRMSNCGFPFH